MLSTAELEEYADMPMKELKKMNLISQIYNSVESVKHHRLMQEQGEQSIKQGEQAIQQGEQSIKQAKYTVWAMVIAAIITGVLIGGSGWLKLMDRIEQEHQIEILTLEVELLKGSKNK